jgi:peptidoglycan/xylan/chitin deacetylase (PgdA/CDA1 family)
VSQSNTIAHTFLHPRSFPRALRHASLRRRAKVVLLGALQTSGWSRAIRWLSGDSPRILLYHRFGSIDTLRTLGAGTFRRQLLLLRKRFRIISLAEIVARLEAGDLIPRNAAAITIDDGYADVYDYAFPILQELEVPATFYVTSGFISGRMWLWPDQIDYALNQTTMSRLTLKLGTLGGQWNLGTPDARLGAWSDIADHCMALSPVGRRMVIADLARALGVSIPEVPSSDYRAASWDQIRKMAEAGVEIGSHTRTHPRLSALADEAVRMEIVGSKQDIEAQLSRPIHSLAYPHGAPADFDDRCRKVAKMAGYTSAMAGTYDVDVLADRYAVKRLTVGLDWGEFLTSVYGVKHLRRALQLRFRSGPS